MIKKLITSAVFAGFGAGLIAALLQIMLLVPIILEAEEYESGAKVHFEMTLADAPEALAEPTEAAHEVSAWSRNFQTALWTMGTYVGFALVLVAGFGFADQNGRAISARTGALWGAAGFIALHLATGMGLAPELPGNAAAALGDRKIWWALTVGATVFGLALLGYGKTRIIWAAGIALLAAPHIIGAPEVSVFYGVVPPELAGEFASKSLGVAAVGWVSLGLFAGYFWSRET